MANKTISDLRELSTVSDSNVLVVETNAETFKVTKENLLKEVNTQLNTKSNVNHTHDEYVTESELNTKGLATETFVTNKIAEASLSGGAVDLSGYATEEYVNTKVAENTDKITVLNAKVDELELGGNITFRDVLVGEKFEINEDNVVGRPDVVYGNIVISTTTLSLDENATTTFTVKLDEAPTNDQVVNLSVNNAYCTLSKTNLTFTSSNYNVVQTVTVAGVHDSSNYLNQTSIINLTSGNVANKTISVTIKNVDTPPVVTVPVTGVTLNQTTGTLKVGETIQLTATVLPNDATNKNVTWSVNNSNATVVNGLVTAKQKGDCIITVTTADGNKTAVCQVVVEAENEDDGGYPFDLVPMFDLDLINWNGSPTLTDKQGNYHFTIRDVSKYKKITDGISISKSSPAYCNITTPESHSIRMKIKYTADYQPVYGRFWRWDTDCPSFYYARSTDKLTFKVSTVGGVKRVELENQYGNTLVDLVYCYDSTTKNISLYADGNLKSTMSLDDVPQHSGTEFSIGNVDSNNYNIDFELYEFQMYNQVLTEEQVRGLCHVG